MKSIYSVIVFLLLLSSCQKSEEPQEYTGFINIDAKLLIGRPSYVSINAVSEFNNGSNSEKAYTFKTVSIVNQDGYRLNLDSSNSFYSEIDFSPSSGFSQSDDFKLIIEFENGDIIESEYENTDKEVFQIVPVIKDALVGNSIGFGMDVDLQNKGESRFKWDILSAYKISNYDTITMIQNCDTWDDICEAVRQDSYPFNFAKGDCDGDGVSNAVECDNGTNPLDETDGGDDKNISYRCYVTEYEPSQDPFFIKFLSASIKAYQLLYSQEVDDRFSEQYVVEAQVESISESYYDYLLSLYGKPAIKIPLGPNPAQGNLKNLSNKTQQVIGFFHVSTYNKLLFSTNSDPDGNSQPMCNNPENQNFDNDICIDCVTAKHNGRARFNKPSFWPN